MLMKFKKKLILVYLDLAELKLIEKLEKYWWKNELWSGCFFGKPASECLQNSPAVKRCQRWGWINETFLCPISNTHLYQSRLLFFFSLFPQLNLKHRTVVLFELLPRAGATGTFTVLWKPRQAWVQFWFFVDILLFSQTHFPVYLEIYITVKSMNVSHIWAGNLPWVNLAKNTLIFVKKIRIVWCLIIR